MHPTELELVGRVALAAVLGAAIGLERELVEKPAGLRTHALVALGAAAFTVAGYGALDAADPVNRTDLARIAAQVASGIGFLGAGIIIFHGDRVRGLTTAAEMWAVAAIGVLCGLGLLWISTGATLLILIIVIGGRPVERVVNRMRRARYQREREKAAALGRPLAGDDEDGDDENGDDENGDDEELTGRTSGGGIAAA